MSAAKEMVSGGPIDVLTGDYLAELTMAILQSKREKDPAQGYVGTFVKQVRHVLKDCLTANIRIVSNAGGLNPKACADAIGEVARELGLSPRIAYLTGDDLLERLPDLVARGQTLNNIDSGEPFDLQTKPAISANAYLGAWGIKDALDRGADIVICPRVTDAALVIGPAAWKFNWSRDNWDALAGALAAGHVIECGPQACGGNYAFLEDVPSFHKPGFPIAEISEDGSSVITKHPGSGGVVNVGTVTAQLVYEVGAPEYLNPDVTARLDSLILEQEGPDRVRISGVKGLPPPCQHKVCINRDGGYRASFEMVLTGLDIEKKAKICTDEFFSAFTGRHAFDRVEEILIRSDKEDPRTNDEASAIFRVICWSGNAELVGRLFSAKAVELGLSSYAGLYSRAAATSSGRVIEHWPALIDSRFIKECVHFEGGAHDIEPTGSLFRTLDKSVQKVKCDVPKSVTGPLKKIRFGRLFGARSGDKGGNANLGVWAKTDEAYNLLFHFLTVPKLAELLPDLSEYRIDRFEFPNIRALNFVVYGLLGEGIAASVRTDGQAKSLGEYLRAKTIEVPAVLAKGIKEAREDR